MTAVADLLLAVALVATGLLVYSFAPANVPRGPDRAMYGFVCVILQAPRWACLTVVLMVCVARGTVPWPADRAGQAFGELLAQVLVGACCFLCGVTSLQGPGKTLRASGGLVLVPVVVPLGVIAFAAWLLNPPLHDAVGPGARAAVAAAGWLAFAAVAVAFAVVGTGVYVASEVQEARERRATDDRAAAETATRAAAADARFAALTPADPLAAWLAYTWRDDLAAHKPAALAAIARRPDLAAEVDRELAGDDWDKVVRTLPAIELLPPAPPASLAGPVGRYGQTLAARLAAAAAEPDADRRRDGFAHAVARVTVFLAAARGLHRAGVDVRPDLTAVADPARGQDADGARDVVRQVDHLLLELRP